MIYTIYYGCGTAELCTKSRKWEERFYHLASQCFGIRKSILCCELIKKDRGYPKKLDDEEYERLSFGDVYIWRKDGWRKQIKPTGWEDKEWIDTTDW